MKYTINDTTLTSIADAIRAKGGTTAALTPSQMAEAIAAIQAGGGGGGDLAKAIIERSASEINTDVATIIGSYAFYSYASLVKVSFPACNAIGSCAFLSCSRLTTINFPVCTSIGASAFQYCSSLTSANFPACKFVGASAFYSCVSLAEANFPVCSSVDGGAFYRCSSLAIARFSAYVSLGGNAFNGCSRLSAVILAASSLCGMRTQNAFYGTPISSGTGYIYVPSSLVAKYQAATNWTAYSAQISAIEDSEFA